MVGQEEIDRFMEGVPGHVVVCFDEAYIELLPPGDQPDVLKYVRQGRNVIVLRTFSKAYGLAGLRVGYAIAPEEGIALLNRVRQPFNLNSMAQLAALAALGDDEHVAVTRDLVQDGLSFFVGESLLVSAMQLGAKGSCSSLVLVNPRFILDMYAKAQSGQWEKAIKMQQYCAQFVSGVVSFVSSRGEGMIDPTGDKGMGVASGCILGHQRCRHPYIGWSDDTIEKLNEWMHENFPAFIYNAEVPDL